MKNSKCVRIKFSKLNDDRLTPWDHILIARALFNQDKNPRAQTIPIQIVHNVSKHLKCGCPIVKKAKVIRCMPNCYHVLCYKCKRFTK